MSTDAINVFSAFYESPSAFAPSGAAGFPVIVQATRLSPTPLRFNIDSSANTARRDCMKDIHRIRTVLPVGPTPWHPKCLSEFQRLPDTLEPLLSDALCKCDQILRGPSGTDPTPAEAFNTRSPLLRFAVDGQQNCGYIVSDASTLA